MSILPSDSNLRYIQWKDWRRSEFGSFTKQDAVLFSKETRNAGINLSHTSMVMEIGFGNGMFAGWVGSKTARYVGTEKNDELVARALAVGIEAHGATCDLEQVAAGRLFDLIAIFDVLEHMDITEILELLKSANKCLSRDGRLIFRVPSGDSPFSGPLMYGDITHRTKLGSKAIHQIANLTGMEVVSVSHAAFPILGAGVVAMIRRLAVVSARRIIGGLIRAAFFGNGQAVISPNLVAVLKSRSAGSHTAVGDRS